MNISLSRLKSFYSDLKTPLLLQAMIRREFPGSVAVLTSFGAEAALLLALIAEIDSGIPVLFLNTGKHFRETLDYATALTRHLGLSDVRHLTPDAGAVAGKDGLWLDDPGRCCALRKTAPLEKTLDELGSLALITGRRREDYPGLESFELDENGVFRIHPLAGLSRAAVEGEMARRSLPPHPLKGRGYATIGCEACTLKAHAENGAAVRWAEASAFEEKPNATSAPATPAEAPDWNL